MIQFIWTNVKTWKNGEKGENFEERSRKKKPVLELSLRELKKILVKLTGAN